ncbi:MAG: HAMP domain-containing histidine kinase [Propionibacteriaceae bacterium]|jgi:two-component system sensor histidine kinase MprB|nr:HAMP domain-containing histidine kinase [Propionibacteriaceae bacterium]
MRSVIDAVATFAHTVRTSLRYRLVFLTTITIIAATAIAGAATYQAARVSLYAQLDQELLSIATNVSDEIAVDFQDRIVANSTSLDAQNVTIALVSANTDQEIYQGDTESPLVTGAPEIAVARIQTGTSARNGESQAGIPYRIVAMPYLDTSTNGAFALVIARELEPTLSSLMNLAYLQWIISLLAILLGGVIAVFVAGATMNPIRELTSVVSRITSTDALTTIEVRGASEVSDLEQSFNAMMESLAASRSQQNRLIADAGHELRTPLTSLRTNIELLIADEAAQMLPEGARAEILSDVAAQLGEFTSLVNDLVALSRGDVAPNNLVAINFANVVERAVERARRRGPSLFFDVTLEPMYIMGDAVMLERAVTNLLDNAVKFSPPGGHISVAIHHGELIIHDQGPGIAPEDIPHIFERFYRSDSSRNTPGTGLGLSIVDHTITTHGGTVQVVPGGAPGATFVVRLPQVEADDE